MFDEVEEKGIVVEADFSLRSEWQSQVFLLNQQLLSKLSDQIKTIYRKIVILKYMAENYQLNPANPSLNISGKNNAGYFASLQEIITINKESPKKEEIVNRLRTESSRSNLSIYDYISLAEIGYKLYADPVFALDIFRIAESCCSIMDDFTALARSVESNIKDRPFALGLFNKALKIATKPDDFLYLAQFAHENFHDEALAEDVLSKNGTAGSMLPDCLKGDTSKDTFNDLMDFVSTEDFSKDDQYCIDRVLANARDLLDSEDACFEKKRRLALARKFYLNNSDYLIFIYSSIDISQYPFHYMFEELCHLAILDIDDREESNKILRKLFKDYEQQLKNKPDHTAYDFLKLSELAFDILADKDYSLNLLKLAAQLGGNRYEIAKMVFMAELCDDIILSDALLEKNANMCETSTDFISLAEYLKSLQISLPKIRKMYESGFSKIKSLSDKLFWTEGIIDVFNDTSWADAIYEQLLFVCSSQAEMDLVTISKTRKLQAE